MNTCETPKSDQLAELGRSVIPAATMSNWTGWVDEHPIYMSHGQGARLYDVDGNEYIDYDLGHGPGMLGHSNPHVRSAILAEAQRLFVPGVNDLEVRAAQKVVEHVPCADLVSFSTTGTEANMTALRVARGYTGRDKYVRFNGHYHGSLDHIMGGIVLDPEHPTPVPGEIRADRYSRYTNTAGRYSRAFDECYMIEWNELPALEKVLNQDSQNIAAVIMEPVMINNKGCRPEPGYLEGVRDLCDRQGVVLIFDEILTGFRIGISGAQGHFGVTPDLATMGKALGAGLPVAAICGRRDVMDTITRAEVCQGGTFYGHPLSMAGVIAAMEEYERDGGAVYRHIDKMGNLLKDGLTQIAREQDQPLLLQGFPGAWTFSFNTRKKIVNHADGLDSDPVKAGRFAQLLNERGVLVYSRFCTSAAHTERDVQDVLDRAAAVMKILKASDKETRKP
jgi:glutamate-1-semialdehyde 2,1-aminomutase